MSELETHDAARSRLIAEFRKSTVGPGQDNEILVDTPSRTYITGYLSPKGVEIGVEENDVDKDGDCSASLEGVPSLINAIRPSAFGLTFHVREGVGTISVEINGAFYDQLIVEEPDEKETADGTKQAIGGLLAGIGKPSDEARASENSDGSQEGTATKTNKQKINWKRVPVSTNPPLTINVDGPATSDPIPLYPDKENINLLLDVRRHDYGIGKPKLVTLTVINASEFNAKNWEERESRTFFQPEIRVTAGENEESNCFAEPPAIGSYREDPDLYQHLLLFRHARDFSTGHGCAVEWNRDNSKSHFASELWTQFIPEAHVNGLKTEFDFDANAADPLTKAVAEKIREAFEKSDFANANEIFSMKNLAGAKSDKWILSALNGLCDAYEHWLFRRSNEIDSAIAELNDPDISNEVKKHAAELNVNVLGPEVVARMRKGIATLRENLDGPVFRSFRLANEAMYRQLQMSMAQSRIRNGEPFANESEIPAPRWRPFQLAFLLLTINSISNPDTKVVKEGLTERELMDLIWFPTGGGKTEAYLGLSAFTLILRRLNQQSPDMGAGVSVITRYTLRLLTTQQFERATRLICALEEIRKKRTDLRGKAVDLGSSKFSIGLWIGGSSTPNRFRDVGAGDDKTEGVVSILRQLKDGQEPYSGADIRQIRNCPWCGGELKVEHMDVLNSSGDIISEVSGLLETENHRLVVRCSHDLPLPFTGPCMFASDEGLPASIVDEEIYANPPSILIGTVDKFVRLAWSSDTRALFGRGNNASELLPPDLIIQDELHLISGPLGTMVGLFETAIDVISRRNLGGSPPPKIVGSTATIRRAEDQVQGLFSRSVRQFPPPELTMGESFFSREIPDDSKARKYLGIMAPGTSGKSLFLRCCGVLLQLGFELPQALRDPYWTVVSYFNSIRELAGGNVLAQDDVPAYINTFTEIRKGLGQTEPPREINPPQELTSRLPSGDIPRVLKLLEQPYIAPDGNGAIDILLATNMISVGVDVDRLGLMMIQGQPKTTSEYIQASSRVGRKHPGLVLLLSNWSRSRDRSHYERFVPYHEAFYREVEPTSVTPWSGPARDRGLSAVMITILRQIEDSLSDSPQELSNIPIRDILEILQPILGRVKENDPSEYQATLSQINERVQKWTQWANDPEGVSYGTGMYYDRSPNKFMRPVTSPRGEMDGLEAIPNSMRTVEPETKYRMYHVASKSKRTSNRQNDAPEVTSTNDRKDN